MWLLCEVSNRANYITPDNQILNYSGAAASKWTHYTILTFFTGHPSFNIRSQPSRKSWRMSIVFMRTRTYRIFKVFHFKRFRWIYEWYSQNDHFRNTLFIRETNSNWIILHRKRQGISKVYLIHFHLAICIIMYIIINMYHIGNE